MKKLVLTLTLCLFALGSSGIKANNFQPVDCPTLMNEVYAAYINSGADKDEAFQAAIWAYEG